MLKPGSLICPFPSHIPKFLDIWFSLCVENCALFTCTQVFLKYHFSLCFGLLSTHSLKFLKIDLLEKSGWRYSETVKQEKTKFLALAITDCAPIMFDVRRLLFSPFFRWDWVNIRTSDKFTCKRTFTLLLYWKQRCQNELQKLMRIYIHTPSTQHPLLTLQLFKENQLKPSAAVCQPITALFQASDWSIWL